MGEAILFFRRHLHKEGLLYRNAKDIELSLRALVNWAERTVQLQATVTTVQEGHQAIVDAIMEKKNEGLRAWAPPRIEGSHLVHSFHP